MSLILILKLLHVLTGRHRRGIENAVPVNRQTQKRVIDDFRLIRAGSKTLQCQFESAICHLGRIGA